MIKYTRHNLHTFFKTLENGRVVFDGPAEVCQKLHGTDLFTNDWRYKTLERIAQAISDIPEGGRDRLL